MRFPLSALAIMGVLTATPALAEIGRVKNQVGQVSVSRNGTLLPVRPGFQLEQGDLVVTGKTGRVGIAFQDDTRMALGPNSRVRLTQFVYDRARQKGAFVTQVDRGSIGVISGRIAKSGRDAMKVRTPTSMLGVRGTKFVVEVK